MIVAFIINIMPTHFIGYQTLLKKLSFFTLYIFHLIYLPKCLVMFVMAMFMHFIGKSLIKVLINTSSLRYSNA